jgi:hypothetical protein
MFLFETGPREFPRGILNWIARKEFDALPN